VLDLGNATPQPLYSWERDLVPIVQEAWWALGPVWMGPESLASTGVEPQIVQPTASPYTNYTILAANVRYRRVTNLETKLLLLNLSSMFSSNISSIKSKFMTFTVFD
jgi:hypothetical protein